MRIAIDARYLNGEYTGIGKYSEMIISHLGSIDQENEYFVLVHSSYDKVLPLGKNFTMLKIPIKPLSFWTLFGLSKIIEHLKVDIFHILFPVAPIFYSGKIIITLHDLQPFTDPLFSGMRSFVLRSVYDLFYRWIYPFTMHRAKWIISVSQSTKEDLSYLIPDVKDKIIVIHSGLDENFKTLPDESFVRKTREKYRLPDKYFLYLGSTRPNKNIPKMLRAYAILREKNPELDDVKFVLCLSNVDRFFTKCYEIMERLRIHKDVFIYKNITEEEKKVFYMGGKFFCFATKYEGFGIPVLEAQAFKLPVLAGESGALVEISGKDGAIFVDPDEPDDIARGMEEILTREELRKRLIECGEKNLKRFNWNATVQKVIDVYNYLV